MMRQLCSALAYLHERRVIHRDIKPSNVLVDTRGNEPVLKLTDFGLARELDINSMAVTVVGTQLFMAPEVWNGRDYGREVDIYSLGTLLLFRSGLSDQEPTILM